MSKKVAPADCREPDPSAPYRDLYIYYLEGRLAPGHKFADDEFIGNWEEDDFSFLFFSQPSDKKVERLLEEQLHLSLVDKFHMTYDQWQGESISPFRVGGLFVAPPWSRVPPPEGCLSIVINPGVVFGAGTHPTTRDCIKALEMLYKEERPLSVLDLGTGTGVLALAAQRLGCAHTVALDINLLAARTARKNVRLNGLEDRVLVVQGRAEEFIDAPADLVLANIHYDVMKLLVSSEGFLKKKWFILSGLMRSEARDIAGQLIRKRANILKSWENRGIWYTFYGRMRR
jgi:ribosomal protein L11 methyltransferase